ncbi:transposase, MuDR, MULE transposase domain protein [Tanacetum coccineum]|uniref:Transposase, MuDR, MULE transposase domain protein n=1 Tax=Tanacetum coccineum TaxID=301880 RepID=A0ABQ5AUG0_9ASTR
MGSNIRKFKCLVHYNGMNRGSILHEDLTYSMLHEMVMKKFNLEANYPLYLSAKLSSIDDNFDITDDHEVQFFVECACNSKDEVAHLYVSQHKTLYDTTRFLENHQENTFYNFFEPTTLENIEPSNNITNTSFNNNGLDLNFGTSEFHNNESNHQNESLFEKQECSFAFGDYYEYEDEKNEFDNVVDDNPLPNYQKWQKYMSSFKPDIPETPMYKSKPMISKHYKKETDVKVGQIFENKEALDLAIRLKALDEGYQFLNDRSAPERYALKCFHFNECAWKIRATRWGKTEKFSITFFNDVHTCSKTQTYPNHRNANKKVIAHILTPKLQDAKRVLKGKDIQQDIMSDYKINISYQQAWRGKDYCMQQIRGSPYESFEMLPYYCYNLERKNEGTVTRIKTDEKGVFEMLFIALGASNTGNSPSMLLYAVLVVQNEFPLAYHAAYTTEEFSSSMSHLQDIQPDAYDKLCQLGPQRWSRAHCPLVRYNYLTSNSVESVNACTVVYRKLPVLKLAETYRAMVQEWYYKRRKLAGLPCGHVIAVTKYLGLTDCLQFVSDWFKKPKYQGTYAEPIHFIGNVQEWEFSQHIRKAIPPRMDNPQPGRPKNTKRIKSQDFSEMISHLTRKISRRFTTVYYTLPPNNTLSGLKQIKNDYDTNVMYDIAKVAGKIQLFVSHHQIDLSTVLIPNDGSLEEAFAVALVYCDSMNTYVANIGMCQDRMSNNNNLFQYNVNTFSQALASGIVWAQEKTLDAHIEQTLTSVVRQFSSARDQSLHIEPSQQSRESQLRRQSSLA